MLAQHREDHLEDVRLDDTFFLVALGDGCRPACAALIFVLWTKAYHRLCHPWFGGSGAAGARRCFPHVEIRRKNEHSAIATIRTLQPSSQEEKSR